MKRLSKLWTLAHVKPALFLPLIALICLLGGVIFWYVGPKTEAAAAGQIQIAPGEVWKIHNPLMPALVRVPEIPHDANETAFLQQTFAEADAAAITLRQTVTDYREAHKEIREALVDEMEQFLVNRPNSAWAPSLRCNLGLYYRKTGRLTLALQQWEAAWRALNGSNERTARDIANTAFAHRASLLASLGRVEELGLLLEATRNRNFGMGEMRHLMNQTLEGYRQMLADPASAYRCGSLALANVSRKLGVPDEVTVQFVKAGSPETGFSVQQLLALAHSQNVRLSAVFQEAPAEIVVPSIVHWAQEHYAAVIEQRGTDYYVVDATFGAPRWIDIKTIHAEASGVFIVPSDRIPVAGHRLLSEAESAEVFGRGNPNHTGDWHDPNCETCPCPVGGGPGPNGNGGNGPKGNGGCRTCPGPAGAGMAAWRISEPYLNLWIHDEPWGYQPSKGERIAPHLAHKQRNGAYWGPYSNVSGMYFGFGWNFNYWSTLASTLWMIDLEGCSAQIALPGGGMALFSFETGSRSATNYYNNYVLTYSFDTTASIATNYTLIQPNGRKLVYDIYVTNSVGEAYDYVLSRIVSPDGAETVLQYENPQPFKLMLTRIIDADNRTNTINYSTIPGFEDWVETIVSANGQVAQFSIDTNNFVLASITDAVGIKSEFTYDGYAQITGLTTPYGTTSFDFTDLNNSGTFELERRITITHPDATKEAYLWYTKWDAAGSSFATNEVPSGTPINTFDNSFLGHRNTWYWNRYQYANLSTAFQTNGAYSDLTSNDKLKGRWRHWLQRFYGDTGHFEVTAVSLEREPSPDGVTQGQKTWYDYADKYGGDPEFAGPQILPSVISRVMPDGTTWYEYHERNEYGHTTNKIEKWTDGGTDYFRTNRFVYAANGIDLLEHWHSHDGGEVREVAYGYNSNHQPLTMTNALGEVTTYTYSGNKLITVQTPSGLLSSNTYNSSHGLLDNSVDWIGGSIVRSNAYTWEYGLLKTHTDERGLTITNYYDELDRLTVREFPDGSYIQNVYYLFPGQSFTNGNGTNILDVTASRDQLGNWTYFEYTPLRQIAKVTNPPNVSTVYEYCACGGPTAIREAYGTTNEFVTSQSFDFQGRLNYVFKPGGINVTNLYDSMGRLVIRLDALGAITNWYDNLGRLVIVSNAFGQVQKSIYDDHDLVRTNIDANGVSTVMTYDDLHRIESQMIVGGGTNSWGYTANIAGPTSHTNELGKVTQYGYNALGWKLSEVFVGVATNSFTYNAAGDLRTLSDGKNQVTKWGYDTFGRVITKTNAADTEILRYSYHLNGALSNRWSAAKGNTVYSYDAAGNLTNVNYNASTDLTFQYDALNRPTNMIDAAGTTTWAYDVTNRFSVEDGPWADDAVTNRWNTAGLTESICVDQPSTTNYYRMAYTYDAARRLQTVSGTAGTFSNYYVGNLNSIDVPSRLVQQRTLPNTAFITNYYDSLARLTTTELRNGSTLANLNLHTYLYNLGHQRTNQTRLDGDVDYLYDDVGQLTSAKSYDSGGTEIVSQRRGYQYDAAWNLTNHIIVAGSARQVNNLNQVTNSASHGAYTYDSNGNRVTADTTRVYQYDDENQLVVYYTDPAVVSTAAKKTEFTYDGRGRLRRRIEYSYLSGWTQDSDTRYIYSGMLCIQERSSSNTPTVSYTVGSDLSGTLEGAGGIGGLLARSHGYSSGAWSTHNFYHADGNGNITAMVDSTQALVASYKYDPYGNSFGATGTLAGANQFRFSSKRLVSPAGLYYYPFRFYDPGVQRWLSVDPIEEEGGVNLYAFVGNEPTGKIDPFGLQARIPLGEVPGAFAGWVRDRLQRYTPLGGRCYNDSGAPEYALVGGQWRLLTPGDKTGLLEDCDGMTCGGGFYAVYQRNGSCRTPGCDSPPFDNRRWEPTRADAEGRPPGGGGGRGSAQGNTPPGYTYGPRPPCGCESSRPDANHAR
jgi:RHS repeat-associated protein